RDARVLVPGGPGRPRVEPRLGSAVARPVSDALEAANRERPRPPIERAGGKLPCTLRRARSDAVGLACPPERDEQLPEVCPGDGQRSDGRRRVAARLPAAPCAEPDLAIDRRLRPGQAVLIQGARTPQTTQRLSKSRVR